MIYTLPVPVWLSCCWLLVDRQACRRCGRRWSKRIVRFASALRFRLHEERMLLLLTIAPRHCEIKQVAIRNEKDKIGVTVARVSMIYGCDAEA